MVKRLTEFQFKVLYHTALPEGANVLLEEHEWYADDDLVNLGVLFQDRVDKDWAYVVLHPDADSKFEPVELESSFAEMNLARIRLLEAIDQVAQDYASPIDSKVSPNVQHITNPVDPFHPIVPPEKLSPLFSLVSSLDAYSPARGMVREAFGSYYERDGNFAEQFQTTGFDSRIWELYLHAYLADSDFHIHPSLSPDFVVSKFDSTVAIEAVTTNPTQESPPYPKQRVYSSTRLLSLPSDAPILDRFDGRFEYKAEDFVPIKLGSALYSKLKKRYWQFPDIRNIPLILAIESFHDDAALHYSSSALATYLYGYRHSHFYDPEGNLLIVPRKVDSHSFAGKSIPSGFFSQPQTQNISAVLFSNSGTVSKFNRMGQQGQYYNPNITLFRFGICYNSDPAASVPDNFSYIVGDPAFPEWWGQGLEMFHNPNALHPVDYDLFPDIAHHRIEDGLVFTQSPPFQPFASVTINLIGRGDS